MNYISINVRRIFVLRYIQNKSMPHIISICLIYTWIIMIEFSWFILGHTRNPPRKEKRHGKYEKTRNGR